MSHRRYEIYLPIRYNDGSLIEPEKFLETNNDLAEQFGACSFFPETFRGTWINQGQTYEDENVRVVMDVEDTPENEAFFTRLKPVLKQRFQQLEIWMVSSEIRVI